MLGAARQLSAIGSCMCTSVFIISLVRISRRFLCFEHSHKAWAGVSVSVSQRGQVSIRKAAGFSLWSLVPEGSELLLAWIISLCCEGSKSVIWLVLSMLCAPPNLLISLSVKLINVEGLLLSIRRFSRNLMYSNVLDLSCSLNGS